MQSILSMGFRVSRLVIGFMWCIVVAAGATVANVAAADNQITIEYAEDPQFSRIKSLLIQDGVLDHGVRFINDTFQLQRSIVVEAGAADGPLYDPAVSAIQIPYAFYTEVTDRYRELESDELELSELAGDAMLHTLFHELGHALVDQLELPIVGREEDAADALANVLLLEYYDNGAGIAGNAAELFALEGEDRGELVDEDFWGEHSLDEQRYFSTLCNIYGSNPDRFAELAQQTGFSEERREICVETYQRLVDDWNLLLEPVFKTDG